MVVLQIVVAVNDGSGTLWCRRRCYVSSRASVFRLVIVVALILSKHPTKRRTLSVHCRAETTKALGFPPDLPSLPDLSPGLGRANKTTRAGLWAPTNDNDDRDEEETSERAAEVGGRKVDDIGARGGEQKETSPQNIPIDPLPSPPLILVLPTCICFSSILPPAPPPKGQTNRQPHTETARLCPSCQHKRPYSISTHNYSPLGGLLHSRKSGSSCWLGRWHLQRCNVNYMPEYPEIIKNNI